LLGFQSRAASIHILTGLLGPLRKFTQRLKAQLLPAFTAHLKACRFHRAGTNGVFCYADAAYVTDISENPFAILTAIVAPAVLAN
jgi:hypothetical protein